MTGKDLKVRHQSKGRLDSKNEFPLPMSDKIGGPPLMTKSHYSFEEAVRFVKAKFPNCTKETLLNHGSRGDVSFFLKKPSLIGIESYPIANNFTGPANLPSYLIISPWDCENIENNAVSHQNVFDRGYVYDKDYGFLDSLPNYDPNSYSSIIPHWRTVLILGKYYIPITVKDLLVTHSELICLPKIIELRLNNTEQIPHRSFFKPIPKSFFLLCNLPAGINNLKPTDLLRRSIQKNLNVFAIVPAGVRVCSTSASDYAIGIEYYLQPQFFALNASDCTKIYDDGEASIYTFQAGYVIDNRGQMERITPATERPWLTCEDPSWKLYQGNKPWSLDITCQHLYAMQSDAAELMDQDECQDFKISKASIALLSRMDFVSLESAVEIAKLGHPKCTTNHLLRMGHQGKFNIVTPIPVEIEAKQYCIHTANNVRFNNSAEDPILLDLFSDTCLDIERYGKIETDRFSSEYWSFDYRLRRKSALESHIVATFYKDNLHKIELKPDRLFISKEQLFRIINDNSNLWDLMDKLLSDESKKRETKSPEPNDGTVAADQKETSCTDSDVRAKEELNQLRTARIAQDEELTESPHKNIKRITKNEVSNRLNFGKSKIDYLVDPKSLRFDPDFPKPTGGFGQKKYWVESEVEDYLAVLMKRRPGSDSDG